MSWPTCSRDETRPATPNSRHRSIEHIERELQTCSDRSAGMTKRHQPWARGTRPARFSFTNRRPSGGKTRHRIAVLPDEGRRGGNNRCQETRRSRRRSMPVPTVMKPSHTPRRMSTSRSPSTALYTHATGKNASATRRRSWIRTNALTPS